MKRKAGGMMDATRKTPIRLLKARFDIRGALGLYTRRNLSYDSKHSIYADSVERTADICTRAMSMIHDQARCSDKAGTIWRPGMIMLDTRSVVAKSM
jgi:hypothetical protein